MFVTFEVETVDRKKGSAWRTRLRLGFFLLAVMVLSHADTALAYRPFDGTDAAVADPGEMEVELQPAGGKSTGGQKTLIAPDTVLNFGLARTGRPFLKDDLKHLCLHLCPRPSRMAEHF